MFMHLSPPCLACSFSVICGWLRTELMLVAHIYCLLEPLYLQLLWVVRIVVIRDVFSLRGLAARSSSAQVPKYVHSNLCSTSESLLR